MQGLTRLINRIANIGVATQSPPTIRRIRTINVVTLFAIVFSGAYALFYALYDAPLFYREIIVLIVSIALFATVFLATRARLAELAMWILIGTGVGQLGVVNWLLGPDAGPLSFLLATPFIASLVARAGHRFSIWAIGIAATAIYFIVSLRNETVPFDSLPLTLKHIYLFVTIAGTILLACGSSLFFRQLIERAEAELQIEKARGDRLLRAILPARIAAQLMGGEPRVIADHFPAATVVFADIVGFTARFSGADPSAMVSDLNRVFTTADELAERYGVEKIKTIGDAYFAACGIPDANLDHAARVADFALDLLAATENLSKSAWPGLRLRIVIHTGPVIAGVIGRTKFAYDIWGDTVNTASRLKDVCAPNEIVLTEATRAALPARYALEARGTVSLRDRALCRFTA